MTITEDPPFVADTLQWCNERRVEKGLKPLNRMPLGARSNPMSCPCGRAADLWVGMDSWSHVKDGEIDWQPLEDKLPAFVREFVFAFDAGELPQYEGLATP